ncbi:unnamed protein product [marine sediment metagenome]|uniref:Uncharacterized protein n=1 Tax=marine sediment metagenome TaxID=412755 RepID=X1RDX6_9ZZZZ
MLIGSQYKIESDALNVIVFKKIKVKNPGRTPWRAIAFFATPQGALKYLADLKLKETALKDMATVIKKQEEIYTLISSLKGLPASPGAAPGQP